MITDVCLHAYSVAQKSGVKAKIKLPPPSAVTTLDVDNFNNIVMVSGWPHFGDCVQLNLLIGPFK